MALFPMFVDLTKARVLVIGAGPEAERKAAAMAPFCKKILRAEACPGEPEVWPDLVILAQRGHPDNARLAAMFRQRHIPVNAADDPALCDFQFPALICRGEVTVGVSTGGGSPVLAGLLREQLEGALTEDLEEIQSAAAALTARLRQEIPDPKERARELRRLLKEML